MLAMRRMSLIVGSVPSRNILNIRDHRSLIYPNRLIHTHPTRPSILVLSHSSIYSSRLLSPQIFQQRNYSIQSAQDSSNDKPSVTKRVTKFIKGVPAWIKHEAVHYWTGAKLLALNIKVSSQLAYRLAKGEKLTRREKDLLERTVADIFRLVPFLIIVVIPFLEFTLPFLIKLFPGMLPSTFETKDQKQVKRMREVKVKLEMAKFFQQCTEALIEDNKKDEATEQEFLDFVDKIKTGKPVSNPELIRFAKVFQDEFTLEKISEEQLKAMCKFFNLTHFGPRYFLVYQLERKLQNLKKDDKMLLAEGVEELTLEELVEANLARGMKVEGRSKEQLAKQLSDWLDLSSEDLPPFLLLLSRSLVMNRSNPTAVQSASQAAAEAVKQMSEQVVEKMAQTLPDEIDVLREKLVETKDEKKQSEREKPLLEGDEPSFCIERDPDAEIKELKKEVQLDDAEDDETSSRLKKKVQEMLDDIEDDIDEIKKENTDSASSLRMKKD